MGGMVWSAKESWYNLVTLIEVGYDPLTGVYMLGLTRIRLVVAEIYDRVGVGLPGAAARLLLVIRRLASNG